MKLRAWIVFPIVLIYPVAAFALGARILMRQWPASNLSGDFLSTIDLPFWWWPYVLGPPTLLLAVYFWQRFRSSTSSWRLVYKR